jgi:hypothetical protein
MKKTGAATVATTIALHGFRVEVLASTSTGSCPMEDVQIGFAIHYIKTYSATSPAGLQSQQTLLNNILNSRPNYSGPNSKESALQQNGFTTIPSEGSTNNSPENFLKIIGRGCHGQAVAIPNSGWQMGTPSWSAVSGPDAEGNYWSQVNISGSWIFAKGAPCP